VIAAFPTECFASFFGGQAGCIDVASSEDLPMRVGKVFADHGYQARPGEETRCESEKRRRAAKNIIHRAGGRFDGIKGNRADY
jgi:hypothetical protein